MPCQKCRDQAFVHLLLFVAGAIFSCIVMLASLTVAVSQGNITTSIAPSIALKVSGGVGLCFLVPFAVGIIAFDAEIKGSYRCKKQKHQNPESEELEFDAS